MSSDLMTDSVHSLPHDATIWQAHTLMRRFSLTHLPVTLGLAVVGIVSRQAIEDAIATSEASVTVKTILKPLMAPVLVFPGDTPLAVITKRMAEENLWAVLIHADATLSLVTTIDPLRAVANKDGSATVARGVRRPSAPSQPPEVFLGPYADRPPDRAPP